MSSEGDFHQPRSPAGGCGGQSSQTNIQYTISMSNYLIFRTVHSFLKYLKIKVDNKSSSRNEQALDLIGLDFGPMIINIKG